MLIGEPSASRLASRRAVIADPAFLRCSRCSAWPAAPLAARAFGRLPGAGLGFAKPLGLLLSPGWCGCSRRSARAVRHARARRAAVLALAGGLVARARAGALAPGGGRWRRRRGWRARGLPADDPFARRLCSARRSSSRSPSSAGAARLLSPDVWGTEKPMDMALLNAANASRLFPPHDPWMAGEYAQLLLPRPLLLAALRRHRRRADGGYNLGLALLVALAGDGGVHARRHAGAAARPRRAGVARRSAGGRRRRRRAAGRVGNLRGGGRGSTPTGRRGASTGSRRRA